jgi:hypothetical protein
MALPITGPINKGQNTPAVSWNRTGYRQAAPHTLVLELDYSMGRVLGGLSNQNVTGTGSAYQFNVNFWTFLPEFDQVIAQVRARLSTSVQDRAALGVDAAEYGSSVDMISSAAGRIGRIASAVRRKDFGALLKAADPRGVDNLKKNRPTWKKSFADNFLEVHFGWVPLAQDIHDATQVISSPLKADFVRDSSHASHHYEAMAGQGQPHGAHEMWSCTISCKVGANVVVDNPALHLASQLGLTNPLSVAWELVPFSFVVDWFANVGQFVGQLDEFAGLRLVNAYTTIFIRAGGFQARWNPYWEPTYESLSWENVCVKRSGGIPTVPLTLKPFKLPSATRAITAVSLMIQQLSR